MVLVYMISPVPPNFPPQQSFSQNEAMISRSRFCVLIALIFQHFIVQSATQQANNYQGTGTFNDYGQQKRDSGVNCQNSALGQYQDREYSPRTASLSDTTTANNNVYGAAAGDTSPNLSPGQCSASQSYTCNGDTPVGTNGKGYSG